MNDKLKPYWDNRYKLFSKFDDGIKFDNEGLWSAKSEISANRIAKIFNCKTIVDAFCGLGGSSIAFAKAKKKVIAIEINNERLEFAKHNSKIYGVNNSIEFTLGNISEKIKDLNFDGIYLDPPWTNDDYFTGDKNSVRLFSKKLKSIIKLAQIRKVEFALTFPHQVDYNEFRIFNNNFELSKDYINGRFIYSTVYVNFAKKTNGNNVYSS